MKISDLLSADCIDLQAHASNKQEALDAVINLMEKRGNLSNKSEYRKAVFLREEEGTTGTGDGIAIPHGKSAGVAAPGLAAMIVPGGVDFEADDGKPVDVLFLLAAPDTKENVHMDVLSKFAVLLMDENFVKRLRQAKTKKEFLEIVERTEAQKDAEEGQTQEKTAKPAGKKKILAVTACPTGIAHTYMAAESLEKSAKAHDCAIKVETRGSGGAKNVLTAQEIAEADCIIVAADTNVPMERFNGKKVIECQVSAGINKADELIERAMSGQAGIYISSGAQQSQTAAADESAGHQIYKHLMNGVSHMLPFVVGGGILIATAFLIDSLGADMGAIAPEMRGSFGSITPAAAWFKSLGGVAFSFMLPILAGFIAMSIADRPGLAVGFAGGALAANGTSGFLGALAAGFIGGYLMLLLKRVLGKLPRSLEGIKPVLLYPLIGVLLIGVAVSFVVEPIMGGINTMLNNGLASLSGINVVLMGIFLAGMMSVDMGGPVNKAAYVFGVAAIAAGNYNIMAAVMIGGMVPPCAIALATVVFKSKFTAEERKSGPANFVMGLSFITEGAIPFAAADPLRVIPACIAGSAVAGGMSTFFDCTLMAPHGGIFVFPVVGEPIFYVLSLVAGTVVGAVLLGTLKKKVAQ